MPNPVSPRFVDLKGVVLFTVFLGEDDRTPSTIRAEDDVNESLAWFKFTPEDAIGFFVRRILRRREPAALETAVIAGVLAPPLKRAVVPGVDGDRDIDAAAPAHHYQVVGRYRAYKDVIGVIEVQNPGNVWDLTDATLWVSDRDSPAAEEWGWRVADRRSLRRDPGRAALVASLRDGLLTYRLSDAR